MILLACISEGIKREAVDAAARLSEMEVGVQQMLHGVGNTVLRQWLERQAEKYPADTQPCECGPQAQSVRRRDGVRLTLLGCGANLARELVFVADGAPWIWRIVNRHFPQAIQMVAWHPASSYLVKIAHAAYGEDSPQAKAWLEPVQAVWDEGRLGSVLAASRAVSAGAAKPGTAAWSDLAAKRTRRRYAKFRAMG